MNSIKKDWLRNIDRKIGGMGSRRRIIYLVSESRQVIEDTVNSSSVLFEKWTNWFSPAMGVDSIKSRWRMRTATKEICPLERIYDRKEGLVGRINLESNDNIVPKLVYVKDFQVLDRDLAAQIVKCFLDDTKLEEKNTILILASPEEHIPNGFSGEIELILASYLSEDDIYRELTARVQKEYSEMNGYGICPSEDELRQAARNFCGMTIDQIEDILEKMENKLCFMLRKKSKDNPHNYLYLIQEERRSDAEKDPAIKFLEVPEHQETAGLKAYTKWLERRKTENDDLERSELRGMHPAKGILMVGVPGTGKTVMAQETARRLGVPLIQFDMSRIQNMGYGESEARLRRYLDHISAFGDCVLLIDEVEKTFSLNKNSHEVRVAMVGILLNWMQSRKCRAFLFLTANGLEGVPGALLRDGRISERFFVFMPSCCDLASILRVKLRLLLDADEKKNVELFDARFKDIIRDEYIGAEYRDPLCKVFEDIVEKDSRPLAFITGANLEKLVDETFRELDRKKNNLEDPRYSMEEFQKVMVAYACSGKFTPYARGNTKEIVDIWLEGQRNDFQNVSENGILPFSAFKKGRFDFAGHPILKSSYDKKMREELSKEIEKVK